MYRAKRAIIVAAGFGSRLHPATMDTPKPLIKVNGVRMIETIITGLHHQGITEIHVVVGYKKEQFRFLCEKYEGVSLIENPLYETCNNISSLYAARDYLEEAIITDGDLMIYHDEVLSPEFERSGYNALWSDGPSREWIFTVEKGIVTHCSRTGGEKGWQLLGISRWSAEDGRRLRRHLETVFESRRHDELFWDDVALFCYPQEYELGIRPIKPGDVVEIDSFEELLAIDPSYRAFL